MALIKYKLGSLITQSELRNSDNAYTVESVVGLSTQKQTIKTKADMEGVSLTSYKLMPPHYFAYVPDTSRRGDKISLALNTTAETFLVSSISVVFSVSRSDILLTDYLFMYFNRPEFDRYARFNSWGSARETFDWSEMCDIDIELPPIEIQQKYVDIYNAMLANQRDYENGLENLKLAVDAIIDQYKHIAKRIPLKDLLVDVDVRNEGESVKTVYGVTMAKKFIPSVANLDGLNLSKYKLVAKGQLACNFMHVGRDESLPIAINDTENPILVSPAYFVFDTKTSDCLAEYVLMWLSREESGRYCWYISDTSVRGGFSLDCFYDIEIPVPEIKIQQYLADLFIVYQLRREINEQLKAQIRGLCPILIRGSLDEATA